MITTRTTTIALALAVIVFAQSAQALFAGDDAPSPSNQRIKDVYVFESQEDPERLVLAMTLDVQAAAGEQPTFDDGALYEFKVDTNGDYVEDSVVQATFTGSGQLQQVTFHGPSIPEVTGGHGKVVRGETLTGDVSLASSPTVLSRPGHAVRAFAGLRDDPTGATNQNVLAIVVEVRRDAIVPQNVTVLNVWATVSTVGGSQ